MILRLNYPAGDLVVAGYGAVLNFRAHKGAHLSEAVKRMSKTINTMATTRIAAIETFSDVSSFVGLTFSRILRSRRIWSSGWILSGLSARNVARNSRPNAGASEKPPFLQARLRDYR
jgi:hypothetical protein